MGDIIHKVSDFITSHKLIVGISAGVLLLVFFIYGGIQQRAANKALQEENEPVESSQVEVQSTPAPVTNEIALLNQQEKLRNKYGELPEGYIWETDGTLFSLGDPSLSAEEVVYQFLNGLRNLDISTSQKLSRKSQVVKRYTAFFDDANKTTDYKDNFMRNMYREALLSMTINEIESTSVFADNKQVFSVNINMLDLTSKSFWEQDIKRIYQDLLLYRSLESDTTKADIYLYDYVLDYYKSGDAEKRNVRIDLTVEKYPDLKTGWLVSIDTDIDLACQYTDGNLVVSYIKERFNDEGRDMIDLWREEGTLNDESSDVDTNSSETTEGNVNGNPPESSQEQ